MDGWEEIEKRMRPSFLTGARTAGGRPEERTEDGGTAEADDDCVVATATDRARGGFVRRNINNKGRRSQSCLLAASLHRVTV